MNPLLIIPENDELVKNLIEFNEIQEEYYKKNKTIANLAILKTTLADGLKEQHIEAIYYLLANFHDRLSSLEKN